MPSFGDGNFLNVIVDGIVGWLHCNNDWHDVIVESLFLENCINSSGYLPISLSTDFSAGQITSPDYPDIQIQSFHFQNLVSVIEINWPPWIWFMNRLLLYNSLIWMLGKYTTSYMKMFALINFCKKVIINCGSTIS